MLHTLLLKVARLRCVQKMTTPVAFAVIALVLAFGSANATPTRLGIPGIGSWADNSTINVVLPPGDPHNADVVAGIRRWGPTLAAQGINIVVHDTAPPPAGTTNLVNVGYPATVPPRPNGTPADGQGGMAANSVGAGANERMPRGTADGGAIDIRNGVGVGAYLQNLAMHEFGHVLGLDDEGSPANGPHNVMDGDDVLNVGVMALSARDTAEYNTIYVPPAAQVTPNILQNGDMRRYAYTVTHLGGSEIPLFQVDPGPVYDFFMPEGWQYSIGGSGGQQLVSFFTTTNPLSSANPVGEFGFWSAAEPTQALAFASGTDFPSVIAPSKAVPEPSAVIVLIGGLGSLLAYRRRRG